MMDKKIFYKMIINNDKVILYMEPENNKSEEPIIDALTVKMFYVLKRNLNNNCIFLNGVIKKGWFTKGYHWCECGKRSTSCDYVLENGQVVNYLCVHYLAYHRDEVSEEDIEKVNKLSGSELLKTEDEEKFKNIIDIHPEEN